MPEADKRRIKGLAATQGLTLRQAILQAFEVWALHIQSGGTPPLDARPGATAAADYEKPGPPNRAVKREQDRRPAESRPSTTPGGGQATNLQAASVGWLRRAARLDWSKCPAAESVPGKAGVWVVRGTRAPLDAIFDALDHGQSPADLLEASGLTQEQLMAVLQFMAEGAASSRPLAN